MYRRAARRAKPARRHAWYDRARFVATSEDERGVRRPTILLVADYYLPGFRAGGPIRSIGNLVANLRDEFDFRVVTRNHDFGDPRPYPGVEPDRWLARDGYHVRYLRPTRNLPSAMRRAFAEAAPSLVYLNSFFSPLSSSLLLLRRLGRLGACPVLLAPRGELAADARRLKAKKKRTYIAVARLLGLYRGVAWHATSEAEREDIAAMAPGPAWIAANLGAPGAPVPRERPIKRPGHARFAFVGRVARMKNLEYALRILSRVRGEVAYDLFGIAEDPAYFAELRSDIAALPSNVRCEFRGPVAADAVGDALAPCHFFLSPSHRESFGHAVLEALRVGLPVVVSDGTYWRDLERQGAGFDIPLADEDRFLAAVQSLIELDDAAYARLSESTLAFARDHVQRSTAVDDSRRMFRAVLAGDPP